MGVKIVGSRPAPITIRGILTRRGPGQVPAQKVLRQEVPYWQQRGWTRQGNVYHGSYQTRRGAARGMIEDRGWGDIRFYMFDPPRQIRQSPHWACFAPRGKKGFQVHMSTRPKDLDSGIITIERLLSEAFQS